MSANLTVDLRGGANYRTSIAAAAGTSPSSGTLVGQIVDVLPQNTSTNVVVWGGPSSGNFYVQVQTSDGVTSGSFTDPTSGLAQLPSAFLSGGLVLVNSGIWSSGNASISSPVDNATAFCSGGIEFAAFQNPNRYARALILSGSFNQLAGVGFIGQKRTTGSGGGFSFSPGSGTVTV